MVTVVLELLLRAIDIFITKSRFKDKLEKNMMAFLIQHGKGVVKNVKIKRRYDEMIEQLRKEEK